MVSERIPPAIPGNRKGRDIQWVIRLLGTRRLCKRLQGRTATPPSPQAIACNHVGIADRVDVSRRADVCVGWVPVSALHLYTIASQHRDQADLHNNIAARCACPRVIAARTTRLSARSTRGGGAYVDWYTIEALGAAAIDQRKPGASARRARRQDLRQVGRGPVFAQGRVNSSR